MSQLKAVQDKLLTQVSNRITPEGYVSDMILPRLTVRNGTGKLADYGNGHLRIVSTIMGGKGMAPRVDVVTRTSNSYDITRHGLEGMVTPDDFANADAPYDARKDETEALVTMLWLAREKGLADALTNTATITQNTTLSGTSQFSDFANSDPLGQFLTARKTIRDSTGLPPNGAVMDWEVAQQLRYHPGILEALGFTTGVRTGALTPQELASALQVDRLLIAKAVHNSAKLGQSDSVAAVWGKHIVFFKTPATAGKKQVSLGYNLEFSGRSPRMVFRSNVDNPPQSEKIVVVDDYEQNLTNVNAAYLIKDAIA